MIRSSLVANGGAPSYRGRGLGAADGRLPGEAAFGEPLCLIATATVMKRGYISRPSIINAGASSVKEPSTRKNRSVEREPTESAKPRKSENAKIRTPK